MDAVTLFTYLKLEQYIPLHVICSVELTCTTNMTVMNATIMRRARNREQAEDGNRAKISFGNPAERKLSFERDRKMSINSNGSLDSRRNSWFGAEDDPSFIGGGAQSCYDRVFSNCNNCLSWLSGSRSRYRIDSTEDEKLPPSAPVAAGNNASATGGSADINLNPEKKRRASAFNSLSLGAVRYVALLF